jgi:hypothetical protein
MVKAGIDIWEKIAEEVRFYPSPHNSQPIKLSIINSRTANVYYDLDLGLPAESYGIPFGHVCAGVFLESLRVIAAKQGFTVKEELFLDELDFTSPNRLHKIAQVTLAAHQVTDDDVQLHKAFLNRQTNRRPYDNRLVPENLIKDVEAIAKRQGYTFASTANKKLVSDIVKINQATLFDDLRNDNVYSEIMQWLRFSREEARTKSDGLSAETMLIPGGILRFAMKHRGMWSYPVIGSLIRNVYLRTMRGVRQLGWVEGPFNTPGDYIEAGRTFMKIWIFFTQHGVYLHPFGTVITNPHSHEQFVKKAGIHENGVSMAWMLFRFGYSKKPPRAFRRPAEVMIIDEGSADG